MTAFSEAWLHEHKAKMARLSAQPVVVLPGAPIVIKLARPFKLLNVLLRMHHRVRSAYTRDLSTWIAAAAAPRSMETPIERARVRIERHSVGTPDHDGLVGGAKPLIDCLLVRSTTHPHGLGFIVDDSPDRMDLDVVAFKSGPGTKQRTIITIEAVT